MKKMYVEYSILRDRTIESIAESTDDNNAIEQLFQESYILSDNAKQILEKIHVNREKITKCIEQLKKIKFVKTTDISTFLNLLKKINNLSNKNTKNLDMLQILVKKSEDNFQNLELKSKEIQKCIYSSLKYLQ